MGLIKNGNQKPKFKESGGTKAKGQVLCDLSTSRRTLLSGKNP